MPSHASSSPVTPIQAVSFDLDGTLYATGAHRLRLLPRLWFQLDLIRAWSGAVKALRGQRHPDMQGRIVADTAHRLGTPHEHAEARLWFFLERTWIPALQPAHVLPGILDALALVDARRLPRAVASDHPVDGKLSRLGLAQGWSARLCAERLGSLKPHPGVIQAAAEALGCPTAALLHIGDRRDTDGEAARAAGARYLHVQDERGRTDTLPARLAALLDDPSHQETTP